MISWQSTLGAGTSKTLDVPEVEQDEQQRLNFLGHPELTRHLAFAALKETYVDDDAVVTDALRHIVLDFQSACREGIPVKYEGEDIVLRLCCICTKGDWPWLATAGNLNRHFRRAAKKARSDVPNVGLCHFCFAGTDGVPCSDAREDALWMATMGSAAAEMAWDVPSPLTTGLPQKPDELALFYRPDLFHNWHLGMGQCFVASSLVLLSDMCAGSSIPKHFEELTHLWRSWCRDQCLPYLSSLLVKQQQNAFVKLILLRSLVFSLRSIKPYLPKISRETVAWLGPSDWPDGCWQKGSTTTDLCAPRLKTFLKKSMC